MTKEIVSYFGEKPKNKIVWKAMYLGLGSLFIPPALGIFSIVIRCITDPISMEGRTDYVGMSMGFGGVILALILSISALRVNVQVYKMGERSWVMWLGLIPAIVIGIFWIFMIVGEILFPH